MDLVFLIAACVVAVGFFVFLFLPQLALSTKSGIQARQEEAGTPAEDDAAGQALHAAGTAAPTSVTPPAGRPGGAPTVS